MGTLCILAWCIDEAFFREGRHGRRAKARRREEQRTREARAHIIHTILADYPSINDMPEPPPPYEGPKIAEQPRNNWDRFLIQTLVREPGKGWRVPKAEEQPGNPDVWRVLMLAYEPRHDSTLTSLRRKLGGKSRDMGVSISNDGEPYKTADPYLPSPGQEGAPRGNILTPTGLVVSIARVREIRRRAFFFGLEHDFEGLEMHIEELEKRFREQRLIV